MGRKKIIVATNRYAIHEIWHRIDLPTRRIRLKCIGSENKTRYRYVIMYTPTLTLIPAHSSTLHYVTSCCVAMQRRESTAAPTIITLLIGGEENVGEFF
jgi:hypothetical protein